MLDLYILRLRQKQHYISIFHVNSFALVMDI